MALLQLHTSKWACVKVCQYWCEYQNIMQFVTLFFHLFKCQYNSMTRAQGRGLIHLKPIVCGFVPPLELQYFEDRLFLVASIGPKAHGAINAIGNK